MPAGRREGAMAEAVDVRLLLRRYVPYLRYDSLESFRADSAAVLPEHFVPAGTGWSAANVLRRKDGTVLAAARPRAGQATLTLDFLGKSRYANGTTVRRDDLVDAVGSDYVADARRMHADPRYADVCYGSVASDSDGALWLQYWFFYYNNDKTYFGYGAHEGDWEMIQLRLGADTVPTVATYAQHATGRRRCAGASSTAATPTATLYRWCSWVAGPTPRSRGRAGTTRSGPCLPTTRTAWAHACARASRSSATPPRGGRAGQASGARATPAHGARSRSASGPTPAATTTRSRQRGPAPGPPAAGAPPAPPAPRITVHRLEDRAVVDYRFPARLRSGVARPAWIVIAVDGLDDDLPPATYGFPVRAAHGVVAHPLALEDRSYLVRATAYSEDAVASRVVTAPVPG